MKTKNILIQLATIVPILRVLIKLGTVLQQVEVKIGCTIKKSVEAY